MTSRSLQYQPLQLLVAQMDRSARFFPRPSHPPVIPPAQRRRVMHSSSSFSNGHIASPPLPSQYPIIWSNSYPLHMSPSASAETIQPGDFSDLPFDLNDLAAHGSYAQDDVYDQSAVSWPEKVSVTASATPISTPIKHGSPQMYAVAVTAGSSHYYDSGYEDVCDAQMHHAQSNAQLSPLQAHHVFYNHPHMASIDSDMSELYSRRAIREQEQHAEPQHHVVPSEFFPAQPELDMQYPISSPPQTHCDPSSLSVDQRVPFPTMDSSPSPPGYGSTSPGLTVDDDFDTGDSDADFEEPEDDNYTGTGGVRRHRRRSTHSSVSFSDSSTRRRPSRIAQPVPVPNLTKKSRGRRVPTAPVIVTQGGVQKNLRTYCCEVDGCGKRFARGEHLKRHVRSIHTNDKPHKCPAPGCGKEFSRHDNLGQHMRVHKGYDADDY